MNEGQAKAATQKWMLVPLQSPRDGERWYLCERQPERKLVEGSTRAAEVYEASALSRGDRSVVARRSRRSHVVGPVVIFDSAVPAHVDGGSKAGAVGRYGGFPKKGGDSPLAAIAAVRCHSIVTAKLSAES